MSTRWRKLPTDTRPILNRYTYVVHVTSRDANGDARDGGMSAPTKLTMCGVLKYKYRIANVDKHLFLNVKCAYSVRLKITNDLLTCPTVVRKVN